MINFDFLNILTLITIFCGVVALVDMIVIRRWRIKEKKAYPWLVEYARAFFPVLLIVVLLRAFVAQPFHVPTGSLEPTIVPGDFILVNQYDYGLRLPLWGKTMVHIGEPETGQIALFRWPVNPEVTFVKRVIGVPGDRISYINKVLYINGKKQQQRFIKDTYELGDDGQPVRKVKEYQEDLNGIKHNIIINPSSPAKNFKDLVVPPGEYLMIGDNRDDSDDSRDWGFVPEKNFIGRAVYVWLSWDTGAHRIRWHRFGKKL